VRRASRVRRGARRGGDPAPVRRRPAADRPRTRRAPGAAATPAAAAAAAPHRHSVHCSDGQNSEHFNGSLNGSPVQGALEREVSRPGVCCNKGLNGRYSRSGKLCQALNHLVADPAVMQNCRTNPSQ